MSSSLVVCSTSSFVTTNQVPCTPVTTITTSSASLTQDPHQQSYQTRQLQLGEPKQMQHSSQITSSVPSGCTIASTRLVGSLPSCSVSLALRGLDSSRLTIASRGDGRPLIPCLPVDGSARPPVHNTRLSMANHDIRYPPVPSIGSGGLPLLPVTTVFMSRPPPPPPPPSVLCSRPPPPFPPPAGGHHHHHHHHHMHQMQHPPPAPSQPSQHMDFPPYYDEDEEDDDEFGSHVNMQRGPRRPYNTLRISKWVNPIPFDPDDGEFSHVNYEGYAPFYVFTRSI